MQMYVNEHLNSALNILLFQNSVIKRNESESERERRIKKKKNKKRGKDHRLLQSFFLHLKNSASYYPTLGLKKSLG